jgi:Tfp pilus assembly protein PilX
MPKPSSGRNVNHLFAEPPSGTVVSAALRSGEFTIRHTGTLKPSLPTNLQKFKCGPKMARSASETNKRAKPQDPQSIENEYGGQSWIRTSVGVSQQIYSLWIYRVSMSYDDSR